VNPPIRRLMLALVFVLAGAVLSFRPVYEPDLGWHLAQGRENAAGRLVRTNVFSFVAPEYRQRYTSWLFDTAAYAAVTTGGDAALQGLQTCVLALTFAAVYAACRTRSAALPAMTLLVLGFLVLEPRAIPRPHLASFAGMATCAWLIERAVAARSARPLAWAVPLVAVWSNVHAECVLAPLLIAVFGAAEFLRPSVLARSDALRAIAIAAASLAATVLNPYGWGLLQYLFENLSVPQLLAIAELQPAYLPVYRAFFVYLGVTVVLLLTEPRRLALWEIAVVVVFGALGARYLRLTPLVFLVAAPMVAVRLTALAARGTDARAMLVTALAAAVFVSRTPIRTLIAQVQPGAAHPEAVFPSSAIAFARGSGLTGPVFNSNNLGGWLAWTMFPEVRTFQDSRLQAYPPDHFRRLLDARSQEAWDDLVRGVDWAILSRARQNQLSGAGRFPTAAWATVYWDEGVEIVVRRTGRFSPLAADHEYLLLRPDAELFELAPRLSTADADRLRLEARRNHTQNRDGFTAAALLCIGGDEAACADAERVARRWPDLDDDVELMRVLR
jgi:hypothetical protein